MFILKRPLGGHLDLLWILHLPIDGLAQDCSDSSALAVELMQSYCKQ